jgi:hypothetical protein
MAPPSACEKSFPEDNVEMQSKKPLITATLLRTDIFLDSLVRGKYAAMSLTQKLLDALGRG